jgi:hypothetical protein
MNVDFKDTLQIAKISGLTLNRTIDDIGWNAYVKMKPKCKQRWPLEAIFTING